MSVPRPIRHIPLIPDPEFLVGYIDDYLNQLTAEERYDTTTIYNRTLVHLFGGNLRAARFDSPVGIVREMVEDVINSIIRIPYHIHLQRNMHAEEYRQLCEHYRNRARRVRELDAVDLLFTNRRRR